MLSYTVTNDTITLVIDGHPYTVPRSSANAEGVLAELRKPYPNEARLIELSSVRAAITAYGGGTIVLKANGEVTLNGEALHPILGRRVVDCFEAHVPFDYLLKFHTRLKANTSQRAVQELMPFLEHGGMPITPDGKFLGYKYLQENYYSVAGNTATRIIEGGTDGQGHTYSYVGATIACERADVCDDPRNGCAAGLHVGSMEFASSGGSRVVIVEVDPADVVCIPYDCSFQKLRCCRYTVVADYKGKKLADGGVRDERNPYGSGCSCTRTGVDEAPGLTVGFGVRPTVNWSVRGENAGREDAEYERSADSNRDGPIAYSDDEFGNEITEEDCQVYNDAYVLGYASVIS